MLDASFYFFLFLAIGIIIGSLIGIYRIEKKNKKLIRNINETSREIIETGERMLDDFEKIEACLRHRSRFR